MRGDGDDGDDCDDGDDDDVGPGLGSRLTAGGREKII